MTKAIMERNEDTKKSEIYPERLNWRQACQLLGCGKTKFYDLVRHGDLYAQRVGKRGLWVERQECERLLDSHILDR